MKKMRTINKFCLNISNGENIYEIQAQKTIYEIQA
jgi:hypothetical protein